MSVRVTLYGGLNEIGGNKFLVEDGDDRIFLDFGTSLGARGGFFAEFLTPRTTTILPDLLELGLLPWVDGLYRQDLIDLAWNEVDGELPESAAAYRERTGEDLVHGILVTHAHVDHFMDLSFVDPGFPVYCTATTRTMLEAIAELTKGGIDSEVTQLSERALDELGESAYFPGDLTIRTQARERDLRVAPENAWFNVGPFRVLAVPVDHSVAGAVAYLVETPSGKTIFYTGDIRFHGSLHRRTKLLRETADGMAPDLLLTEGTRIGSSSQENETGVLEDVTRLVDGTDQLAIAEFGWKDTTRFDTLQKVAEATGRKLVINPKLAYLLRQVDHLPEVPSRAPEHYDNVAVYLKRRGTMRYQPSDYTRAKHEAGYHTDWSKKAMQAAWKQDDDVVLDAPLAHLRHGVRAPEIAEHPEDYLVHLTFWDVTELFDLAPPAGSRWIRCLTEPYSDEMELDLVRQANWMDQFELAHNVTEDGALHDEGLTHVSGHAAGTDMLPFIESIQADVVAPIHTGADNLHVFEDHGLDPLLFEGMDFRDAAAGKAVIEL